MITVRLNNGKYIVLLMNTVVFGRNKKLKISKIILFKLTFSENQADFEDREEKD